MNKSIQGRWQLSSSSTVFMYKFSSLLGTAACLLLSRFWMGYQRGLAQFYILGTAFLWSFFRHQGLRDVAIDGNFFVVKHANREEKLSTIDLKSIRTASFIFKDAISLRFNNGREVRFAAPTNNFLTSSNSLVKELMDALEIENH